MLSVKLDKISKSFGQVRVLKELDFTIGSGELFSLVGPSGSGKTTLLRVIAGLEHQNSGHVLFGSKVVDDLTPSQRNVGMVFQDYALYPNKTVLDNIISPLVVKGVKKQEAVSQATEMASKLMILQTLKAFPGQISGGQQQRVALARSLIKRPDVFLMDEPLSNLDAQLRFSARKFLKTVQRDFGITTIYVTHDQSEALSIADKMAIMDNGIIHQIGTPKEVYTSPSDEFVAAFVGSPPLNIIKVTVQSGVSKPLGLELAGLPDGEARIGIRPEHIIVGVGSQAAKVVALEYAGKETIVFLSMDGVEIRALTADTGALREGEDVKFSIMQGKAMILAQDGAAGVPN